MSVSNSAGLFFAADRNRQCTFEVDFGEADGDEAVVAEDDNVRIKIGGLGQLPLLEIQSDAATANGSTCTAANPTEVTIQAADLSFAGGIYDIEALVVDKSDAHKAPKHAENGVFHLRDTMGGPVSVL